MSDMHQSHTGPKASCLPPRPPAVRERGRRLALPILGVGALGLLAAACGGGSTPASSNTAAPAGSRGSGGTRAAPPGTFGTVAAVSGSTLQVQNPSTGQVAVDITPSTVITERFTATPAELAVGECVTAAGTLASGVVAARTVTLDALASGDCSLGGAGTSGPGAFGGGFGRFRTGAGAGRRTSGAARARFANLAIASGKVSAITGTKVDVQPPPTPGTTSTARKAQLRRPTASAFTYSSSTHFAKLEAASQSAITVGVCVDAFGPSDSTGALTATRVLVSQPGPNGCAGGFGRAAASGAGAAGARSQGGAGA